MSIDSPDFNDTSIQGVCDPKFQAVADCFENNFRALGEVGASVCVSIEGENVVDLWGGIRNVKTNALWERDTISVVFSNTKAATALCAQILADRGKLDLDAKVTEYWPEFGQHGKEQATVGMLLNHSVGLPALRRSVRLGGFLDWEYMVERLAAEKPFWKPGTANGYHMVTFGWLVGEVVRRVSGKSLGQFFQDEIASPLGLDYWIGLPSSADDRMAPVIPYAPSSSDPTSDFLKSLIANPKSIQSLSLMNSGRVNYNSSETHRAEIGGGGGIGNARSLCGFFNPLANDGRGGGKQIISAERIAAMSAVSMETSRDRNLLIPTRFGQGFMLPMDNREAKVAGLATSWIVGKEAFGHVGMGGSTSFADPACRMSFAYTMNNMGGGFLLNERGQSLVDAAYAAVVSTNL